MNGKGGIFFVGALHAAPDWVGANLVFARIEVVMEDVLAGYWRYWRDIGGILAGYWRD